MNGLVETVLFFSIILVVVTAGIGFGVPIVEGCSEKVFNEKLGQNQVFPIDCETRERLSKAPLNPRKRDVHLAETGWRVGFWSCLSVMIVCGIYLIL